MASYLPFSLGFKLSNNSLIDSRFVMSKTEMKNIVEDYYPERYFCICSDDGLIYLYYNQNIYLDDTGKFRPLDIQLGTAEDGQILMYKNNTWTAVDLADENSIIYITDKGLSIKGYDAATLGLMLVKDTTQGLAWINPVDTTQLNEAVAAALASATTAANEAVKSGNYAVDANTAKTAAETAATNAETINTLTVQYVEGKFWWGTLEEYNALESITEGTFYFIVTE